MSQWTNLLSSESLNRISKTVKLSIQRCGWQDQHRVEYLQTTDFTLESLLQEVGDCLDVDFKDHIGFGNQTQWVANEHPNFTITVDGALGTFLYYSISIRLRTKYLKTISTDAAVAEATDIYERVNDALLASPLVVPQVTA